MADDDKNIKEEAAGKGKEEELAEGAEGDAGAAAKKKKRLMMMISVGITVVGGLIGGGVFFMMGGEKEPSHDEEVVPKTYFFDIPEFNVNLVSGSEDLRFLKLKVALEVGSEQDVAAMESFLPILQDDYQAFLRQLRVEDLRGNAALARLKESLTLRTNQIVAPLQVKNVLFREVLVQ